MRFYVLIFISILHFNCYSQNIIDLIEGDESLIWTVANEKIQVWNINDILEQPLNEYSSPFNSLSIGYVNINEDTILNTFIVA